MAKKDQTVAIRLTMNGSQAENTMDTLTRKLGEMKDEYNSFKKALKASGLNINTASDELFAKAGLGADFRTKFNAAKNDYKNMEKLVKTSTITIKDLTKNVLDITHMTKEDIEKTMRDISRLYAGMAPDDARDKKRMLTLQSLYEQATQALAKHNIKLMTGADASKIYTKAQDLMAQGLKAEASELRDIADALGRASKAEGISVAESQLYLQAQAEVNRVLQARGTAFVDAAKGAETLAKSQELIKLSREGKADVSVEKQSLDRSTQNRIDAENRLKEAEKVRTQGIVELNKKQEAADQKRIDNQNKINSLENEVNTRRAALTKEALTAHYDSLSVVKSLNKEMEKETAIAKQISDQQILRDDLNRKIKFREAEILRIEKEIAAEQAKANPDANRISQLNVDKGSISALMIEEKKQLNTVTQEIQNQNDALSRQQNITDGLKTKLAGLEAIWKGQEEARKKLVTAEEALAKARRSAQTFDSRQRKDDEKGRKELEEKVTLAKQEVEAMKQAEQSAMQVYQNALKYGGVDLTTLKQMYQELEFVRDHTKDNSKVNEMNITLRDLKQRIDELSSARRPLQEIFDDISGAKSISQMERLKSELSAIFKDLTDPKEIEQSKNKLAELENKMKELSTIKPRPLKDILTDIGNAKSLGDFERLREELRSTFKVLTDPKDISDARAKMDSLDGIIKNWGTETVRAFQLLKNPENYNLSQIEAAIKQLQQNLSDTNVGPQFERRRQFLRDQIAHLKEYVRAEEEAAKAPKMSVDSAQKIARGENTEATVAQLKEAKEVLEAFRQTLKATDADGLKGVNADLTKIEQTFDRINGKAKEAMSADAARTVVESARQMVSKIRTEGAGAVDAKAVDEMIANARRAQEANEINLRTRQEAAAVERELTEIIKGQNVVMLEKATIDRAVSDATKLIGDGEKANVGTLQQTIEVYKQMVAQENIDIQTKQQYAATLRQLEELYKNGRIDAAATEQKYQQMLGADGRILGTTKVTEVKALVEAFRQLAIQEGTTAEEAARYDQYVRNLEQSTKSQTTAVKEQMSIEQARRIARGEEIASLSQMESALKAIEREWKNIDLFAGTGNEYKIDLSSLQAEQQKLQSYIDLMKQMPKYSDEQLARAQSIGANPRADGVLIGELAKAKEVLEAFKQSLATTDSEGLKKVNEQLKNIQNEIDRVNDKAKATAAMTQDEAKTAVDNLQKLITKYRTQGAASVDTKEMNDAIAAAKKAQSATGVSIQLSQKASAVEREATEIMRGKNVVMLEQATINKAVADAANHLADGNTAEVNKVRETIEVYKQMVAQEGLSIEKKKEYAETLRRLESLYKNGMIDANELSRQHAALYERGIQNAQVQDIQRVIDGYRQLKTQYGTTASEAKLYDRIINELEKSMRREAEATHKATSEAKLFTMSEHEIADVMNNLKNTDAETLEKTMLALRNKIKASETSLKDFIKASMDLRRVQKQVNALNKEVNQTNQAFSKQGDFITRTSQKLMQYMGVFGGMMLVRQKMTEVLQANMKFDDSLSNIRKTTGLTSEAVLMLADNIKRIDTRTTLDDMMELTYSAGRLGVKSVSDIMGFTRAANHLKVALGEQLGDKASDAVESIMKVSSIMGAVETEGLEQALEKVGSSINHITMNSQATAEPMINFMRRIGGLGKAAGMQISEVAGLAGAINALGQNTEMAATSVSTIMVQISRNSQKVAKALQMTTEETSRFMYDISSGHMTEAFLTVLQKTKESGGLSHLGTIVKDLGSDGKRTIQVINTLAQNYETVADMIQMSNDAYQKGTSVIDEYNIKNENTAALWERLKNNFSKNLVNAEFTSWIKDILIDLQDLPDKFSRAVGNFKWIIDMFTDVASVILKCQTALSALVQAMMFRSLASGAAVMGSWVKQTTLFTVSLFKTKGAIIATEVATKGLVATIKGANFGNVFMVAATAVLYLVNCIQEAKAKMEEIRAAQAEVYNDAIEQYETTAAAVNNVLDKLSKVEEGTAAYKKIIDEINSTYETYLTNILKEGDAYAYVKEQLELVTKQMKVKALMDAQSQYAERIKQENQLEEGKKLNAITARAARFMPGYKSDNPQSVDKAQAAASTYLAELLRKDENGNFQGLERFFDVSADESGKRTWKIKSSGVWASDEDRKQYQDMLRAFGQMFGVKSTDSGFLRRIYGDGTTSTGIGDAIVEYLNEVAEREYKVRQGNATARQEAANAAKDTYDEYRKDVLNDWKAIAEDIEYRAELKNGAMQVEQQDSDHWVDVKTNGEWKKNKSRNDKIKELNEFLRTVDDYLVDIEAMLNLGMTEDNEGNNLRDLRRMWENRQSNAYELRRVLEAGQLEQMPTNGDPNKKANTKGQEEYKNIIAKIEEFYKHRADELEQEFNHGLMTRYAYEEKLKDNEQMLNQSLASVREAIGNEQESYSEAWIAHLEEMKRQQDELGNKDSSDALDRIIKTSTTGNGVRDIRKLLTMGNDGDVSILSEMLKVAADNMKKYNQRFVEKYESDLKAMLERNPMGKVTDQFLDEFQQLGLMFADLSLQSDQVTGDIATDQARLRALTHEVMAEYLQLGEKTSRFDVTSEQGLAEYRKFVSQLPRIGAEAAKQSDEKLRSLYYEAYNYAETYSESITKLIEKQRKIWDKMYAQTRQHIDSVAAQSDIRKDMKGSSTVVSRAPSSESDAKKLVELRENMQDLLDERMYTLQFYASVGLEPNESIMSDINSAIEDVQGKIDKLEGPRIRLTFGSEQLTRFGGSDRLKLEQDVSLKQEQLNDAQNAWESNIAKEKEKLDTARQGYEQQASRKGTSDFNESKYNASLDQLKEAQQFYDQILVMPETVRTATEAMTESMINLKLETMSWASEMVSAFEKFGEGFVAFRSFYDDKGDMIDNIFGTVEDRQKAAAEFIDDIKKTVRKSIVEYTRLRVQKSVQDKMQALSERMLERSKLLFHKEQKAEEVATDIAADKTEVTSARVKTEQEEQMSAEGTAVSMSNKATETTGNVLGNLAQAVSKAFADLGPIAGAVAAGVVSAAIGSLLTMAMNALGHDNHGSKSTTKTKIVSGMLTYDRGNVQSFRGIPTLDEGGKPGAINMVPVVGDDGHVYAVPEGDFMGRNGMSNYTGIVRRPTLTSVGGQTALVGERGPEMVIGRETTQAMQMYRPDLLRQIVEFDRNRSRGFAKTFDEGNVQDVAEGNTQQADAISTADLMAMIDANTESMQQMAMINAQLTAEIKKGIGVRRNGPGGVIDEVANGFVEARRLGYNKNVTRLFGSK